MKCRTNYCFFLHGSENGWSPSHWTNKKALVEPGKKGILISQIIKALGLGGIKDIEGEEEKEDER